MREELYTRVEAKSVEEPAAVESVPSEQLWRAAILAARQAALAAAELRRVLEAGDVATADEETPIAS